jgi:hypothetical protein
MVPKWPRFSWFHKMAEIMLETIEMPPAIFFSLHIGKKDTQGSALRMGRRGVQAPTPSWKLMNKAQLREGRRLEPLARLPTTFKTPAGGRPRTRRYALVLPDSRNPWTKTSGSALQSVFGTGDLGAKCRKNYV